MVQWKVGLGCCWEVVQQEVGQELMGGEWKRLAIRWEVNGKVGTGNLLGLGTVKSDWEFNGKLYSGKWD